MNGEIMNFKCEHDEIRRGAAAAIAAAQFAMHKNDYQLMIMMKALNLMNLISFFLFFNVFACV